LQYCSFSSLPLSQYAKKLSCQAHGAELLGFSSAGDFSCWFRSQFGKTPSDWAAAYRESKATLPL
jgi:hypothetical protein